MHTRKESADIPPSVTQALAANSLTHFPHKSPRRTRRPHNSNDIKEEEAAEEAATAENDQIDFHN